MCRALQARARTIAENRPGVNGCGEIRAALCGFRCSV